MSLAKQIHRAVDKAFNLLDDLVIDFVLTKKANGEYDAEDGTVDSSESESTCRGFFDEFDDSIERGADDIRIFLQSDIEPSKGDILTSDLSVEYKIVRSKHIRSQNLVFVYDLTVRE